MTEIKQGYDTKILNVALQHPDPSWAYFHILNATDKSLMDELLVKRNHYLAFEPGTPEYRFRELHKMKYKF